MPEHGSGRARPVAQRACGTGASACGGIDYYGRWPAIYCMHVAFLGCGFITEVHSRHLRRLGGLVVRSYASRDGAKAEAFRRRFGGEAAFDDYRAAIDDPRVDAVVVAVPPILSSFFPTLKPGNPRSTINAEMPLTAFDRSVIAITVNTCARPALVM